MLQGVDQPLVEVHDLVMLDLDGVLFHGGTVVPTAPAAVAGVRDRGTPLAFVTNNASRSPAEVADHLQSLGVTAAAGEVATSSQAAAGLLADRLGPGARVAVLGAAGLRDAVSRVGLVPVAVPDRPDHDRPDALVTGFGPEVVWSEVIRAGALIASGVPWVAANADLTFPTDFGTAPGHGALVRMLSEFSGVVPQVAGKPEPALFERVVDQHRSTRPLMVGDRLDTDILGARRAGVDSLLVLSGVSGLHDLLTAPADARPTYLGLDVSALLAPAPAPQVVADRVSLGGWQVRVDGSGVQVTGAGELADWWRVVATAGWSHLDRTGEPAPADGLVPPRG